ncbi:MAG: T9SS type A sorting domain-containing protein [Cryomorphaceae bacterium]|nr:T9SS type A sorting domain-containing protein [Cryomorphaceae bacterium]
MKRKITSFFVFLGLSHAVYSQIPQIDFSTNFNDSTWIPSGILLENNPELFTINLGDDVHPFHFDGSKDSVSNRDVFVFLYDYFYFAAFNQPHANFPLLPDTLENNIYSTNPANPIRLGLIDHAYQTFSDSAISGGYLVWDTVPPFTARIVDSIIFVDTVYVIDTTANPHDTLGYYVDNDVIKLDPDSIAEKIIETRQLFAGAVLNNHVIIEENDPLIFDLDILDIFDDEVISGPYQLSIDGGSNYHSINANSQIVIHNHNLGSGIHQIILRKGTTVEAPRTIFELNLIITYAVIDYQVSNFNSEDCPQLDFSAGIGSGIASFIISGQNNGKINKPVIIVEGIDILNYKNSLEDREMSFKGNLGYGIFHVNTFFSNASVIVKGLENPFKDSKYLHDSLLNLGYDIVYLDFKTSRENIRKNANYLIQLIQYVNDSLTLNNSDEQIAIMGLGTGGVISRVALREMELQSCCHNTRMFTSFDAPHRGFTFPLGLQSFMEDTQNYTRFRMKRNKNIRLFYENIILSPMFSELLIYNLKTNKMQNHLDFLQYLDYIGMPQGSRNFAVTNGNDEGLLQHIDSNSANIIAPGNEIFDFTLKMYAPPSIIASGASILRVIGNVVTQENWYLARGIPLIGDEASSQNSFDIYKSGPGLPVNTTAYIVHNGALASAISTIIIIKKAEKALIAAAPAIVALFPPPNPALLKSFIATVKKVSAASILKVTIATDVFLTISLILNEIANNSNLTVTQNPYPMLNYDNAPGGRYYIPRILHSISSKSTGNLNRPEHNFVSTLSALNIDDDNLRIDIKTNKDRFLQDRIIPFEDYHSAISYLSPNLYNELHCLFTIGNSETIGNLPWFLEKLTNIHNPAIPSPQAVISLHGETLNYGVPANTGIAPEAKLRNMNIYAHGKAAVNTFSDNVGFPFQQLSPPSIPSSFTIETQSPECGGTYCRVDSLGEFQIGEFTQQGNSTEGHAVFLDNSTLEIMPYGKLVIDRNSSLTIEEGATLIIHPGAIIELNGRNAILEIKGKVEVKDNAVFTFTYQNPNDFGYIIFNQRQWDDSGEIPISEYWEIGDNAQFVLEGPIQHGNILMECKRNFRTSSGSSPQFSLIKIRNGAIKIHESRNANLTADSLFFEYVVVDKADVNQNKHQGVQLWGMSNKTADISHVNFSHGRFGLYANQLGVSFPLYLHNCSFSNNDTAVYFENGSFDLHDCTFDNGPSGVKAERSVGLSKIRESNFFGTKFPVSIESDYSADLSVLSCNFYGNNPDTFAIYHNFTDVQMKCSKIENYQVGVYTKNAILSLNNGKNEILACNRGVYLDQAVGITLSNGGNYFIGNIVHDIAGKIVNDNFLDIVNINGIDHINAAHNIFQVVPGGFNTHILVGNSTSATPLHSAVGHAFENCSSIVQTGNPFDSLISHIPTEIEIVYMGHTRKVPEALLLATNGSFGDEFEGYIYTGLEDIMFILDEVSTVIDPTISAGDKKVFRIGFSMMFNLLRLNYHYGNLEPVLAEPEAEVNEFISSMDNYIDVLISLIPEGPLQDENIAIWEIIRAHLFRLGQHHQYGLDALQSIGGDLTAKTVSRKNYWECVMGWESEMLQGNIEHEEFYQEFAVCGEMYSPYVDFNEDYIFEDIIIPNPKGRLSIYPNPSKTHIYVRMEDIAAPEDNVHLTITGMDGRLLFKQTQAASYLIGVNIENLPQGAYILTITTPYKKHNGQFLIAR